MKGTVPYAFNTAPTSSSKRQMKRKIQKMIANKDSKQNKVPRYVKSTVKIENPATVAPYPISVRANKHATENKSPGSDKSTVKIEKPEIAAQFPKSVPAQVDPWKISSIQAALNRRDDVEEQKVEQN